MSWAKTEHRQPIVHQTLCPVVDLQILRLRVLDPVETARKPSSLLVCLNLARWRELEAGLVCELRLSDPTGRRRDSWRNPCLYFANPAMEVWWEIVV